MAQSFITLLELNLLVKGVIKEALVKNFWIAAEISEIRENYSGHCYLEFIQKDDTNDNIIAKSRANIWANTYRLIRPYFENATGSSLTQGMKVLVHVSVEFHELYGYSLSVLDIDPTYTLGDMEQKKIQTIQKLISDGVFEMNQELEMPLVPQRIAVISSSTAAGYDDFISHLMNNEYDFVFYPCLFKSTMQGDGAEASILMSLEKIYNHQEQFDVVVIIRGGGSKSELSCFDSYDLASHICQFPLPVISGIGHERDQSVVDMIAHTRVKTPTAAAIFLIEKASDFFSSINEMSENIVSYAESVISEKQHAMDLLSGKLSYLASGYVQTYNESLLHLGYRFGIAGSRRLSQTHTSLNQTGNQIKYLVHSYLSQHEQLIDNKSKELEKNLDVFFSNTNHRINSNEKILFHCMPENILKKGFSLTYKNNKIVESITKLKNGDSLITKFKDGEIESIVNKDPFLNPNS